MSIDQSYKQALVRQNAELRKMIEQDYFKILVCERKIIRITTARWWTRLRWVFTGVKA